MTNSQGSDQCKKKKKKDSSGVKKKFRSEVSVEDAIRIEDVGGSKEEGVSEFIAVFSTGLDIDFREHGFGQGFYNFENPYQSLSMYVHRF